ncbi:hypothetical protein [Paenibacillus sp. GXUN7292]|uniref:hypothetical protein n=1 Tax=Paenibacillus sp. GXUN7292 TaxID=3422499 RepID=UPI003D7D3274
MAKTLKAIEKEAAAWKAQNAQIKEWLLKHPSRIQPGLWSPAINLTEVLEAELEREMKNARRPGRTSLRYRLQYLVLSILALSQKSIKTETGRGA